MPSHRRNKRVICLTLSPENVTRLDVEAQRLGRSRSWVVDWVLGILLAPDKSLTTTLEAITNDDNSAM